MVSNTSESLRTTSWLTTDASLWGWRAGWYALCGWVCNVPCMPCMSCCMSCFTYLTYLVRARPRPPHPPLQDDLPFFEQAAVIHDVNNFKNWVPCCDDSRWVGRPDTLHSIRERDVPEGTGEWSWAIGVCAAGNACYAMYVLTLFPNPLTLTHSLTHSLTPLGCSKSWDLPNCSCICQFVCRWPCPATRACMRTGRIVCTRRVASCWLEIL